MPVQVIKTLTSAFTQAPTLTWLWLIGAAGAVLFIMLLGLARSANIGDGGKMLGVSAAAIAAATLPNMLSYSAVYAMVDSILMITAFMPAAIGIGAYAILRKLQHRGATSPQAAQERGEP